MVYKCFICKLDVSNQLQQLNAHFRLIHRFFVGTYMCYQNGCMRTFSRYSSLRKHILKEHPSPEAAQEPFANENAMFQLCGNGDSDSDTAIDDVVDNQEEKSEDDCSNWNLTDDFGVSKQGALFIAKLKASSSMTLFSTSSLKQPAGGASYYARKLPKPRP